MNILFNKTMVLFILLFAVLLPFGCTENEKGSIDISTDKNTAEHSYVLALLPGTNVFLQKKTYNALAAYLSRYTSMNITTKLLDSYAAIYSEMKNGRVDAAVLGGLSYVVIDSKIPLEPIARPYLKNGTSTYNGLIFTAKDRGITGDVKTWKDKRFALVNRSSYTGYVFPMWYLYKNGVKDINHYFKSVIYTGSADSSISAVFKGEADIGCSSKQRINDLLEKDPLMRRELAVIASSPSLPSGTFVMKKNADPILKEKIKAALLNMDKEQEGSEALSMLEATHFIETKRSEYSALSGMINDLGLKPDDFTLEFVEILHLPPES